MVVCYKEVLKNAHETCLVIKELKRILIYMYIYICVCVYIFIYIYIIYVYHIRILIKIEYTVIFKNVSTTVFLNFKTLHVYINIFNLIMEQIE